MAQVRRHDPLAARGAPQLAQGAVHVPVAAAHHRRGLALAAARTLRGRGEVGAGSGVRELDPGAAGGLLEVAGVAVGGAVVAADVADLAGAAHAGAGLDLVLALLERHLHHLVIPAIQRLQVSEKAHILQTIFCHLSITVFLNAYIALSMKDLGSFNKKKTPAFRHVPSPGEGEAAGHLHQLALAGVQLAVAAAHGLARPVLLLAVGGAPRAVQLVQAEGGRHLGSTS